MKYSIEIKDKAISLTRLSDNGEINNLNPYEAYKIIHGDDIPNKIVELMDTFRVKLADENFMFGREIKEILNEQFNPIMNDAGSRIELLEKKLKDA